MARTAAVSLAKTRRVSLSTDCGLLWLSDRTAFPLTNRDTEAYHHHGCWKKINIIANILHERKRETMAMEQGKKEDRKEKMGYVTGEGGRKQQE